MWCMSASWRKTSLAPCLYRWSKNLIWTVIYCIIMQRPQLMVKWNISEHYAACHHTKWSEWWGQPGNRLNNALPFSTLCVLHQTVYNHEASVIDTVNYFQYFLPLHLIMASESYDLTLTYESFMSYTYNKYDLAPLLWNALNHLSHCENADW